MVKPMIVCILLMVPVSLAENWPGFRGPGRQGISSETKAADALERNGKHCVEGRD